MPITPKTGSLFHADPQSAEDSESRVLVPRLIAAGADLTRCHILDPAESTAQAVEWIEALLDELPQGGRGAIVEIDPITAFMGNKDPNNVAHVRSLLRPMVEMGWRRKVTVIAIHHLRKAIDGNALDLVLGSGGFTHAARVVHLVFPDPDRSGRNLLLAGENNLGAKHPGYAYQIVPETIRNGIEVSRLVWEDQPVNMDADQVLVRLRKAKSRPKTEEAKDWLRDFLSKGAMAQAKVQEAALDAGLSLATLRKAKDEMKIKSERVGGRNGEWVWSLATVH